MRRNKSGVQTKIKRYGKVPVVVWMPEELANKLTDLADKDDRSRTSYIVHSLKEHVEAVEGLSDGK